MADDFCTDVGHAIDEGKQDFARIKGPRDPDTRGLSTYWYTSTFTINGFSRGCDLTPYDDDRPDKLNLSCKTQTMTNETEARDSFNRLSQQFSECMKSLFPKKTSHVDSDSRGMPILKYSYLAKSEAGWQLSAELNVHKSSLSSGTKYSVNLDVDPH
jgi:hypothetical protein